MKLMGREKLIERMKLFQMTEEQKKLTTMRTGMVMKQRFLGGMVDQWRVKDFLIYIRTKINKQLATHLQRSEGLVIM